MLVMINNFADLVMITYFILIMITVFPSSPRTHSPLLAQGGPDLQAGGARVAELKVRRALVQVGGAALLHQQHVRLGVHAERGPGDRAVVLQRLHAQAGELLAGPHADQPVVQFGGRVRQRRADEQLVGGGQRVPALAQPHLLMGEHLKMLRGWLEEEWMASDQAWLKSWVLHRLSS